MLPKAATSAAPYILVLAMELFAAAISVAVRVVDGPTNSYRVFVSGGFGRYAPASPAKVAVKAGVLPPSLRGGRPPVLFGTAKMMYQGSASSPASPKFHTPK